MPIGYYEKMERHLILSYILEFTTIGQNILNNANITLKLLAKNWNFFYAYSAIYVDVITYNKHSSKLKG